MVEKSGLVKNLCLNLCLRTSFLSRERSEFYGEASELSHLFSLVS